MRHPTVVALGEHERSLAELDTPFHPDALFAEAPAADWEVELGFGKGRYLLRRAAEEPPRRFLGIERVSKYYRLARRRGLRRRLDNLLLIRGEALAVLSAVLVRGFASVLHVYFPDPWPKGRHQKRRMFDPETVDLVLGVLRPGGELCFATDFLDYGERVAEILDDHPGVALERRAAPWPDGARTNYEAKYVEEGRPILRLVARLADDSPPHRLHPRGAAGVLAATAPRSE